MDNDIQYNWKIKDLTKAAYNTQYKAALTEK